VEVQKFLKGPKTNSLNLDKGMARILVKRGSLQSYNILLFSGLVFYKLIEHKKHITHKTLPNVFLCILRLCYKAKCNGGAFQKMECTPI
jgi:hypothetical protein